MRALILLLSIASTAQAAAKWTVLSYFAADNNLEKDMVGNIVEMSKVGSNADINIVVQLDRGYKNADAMMANFPGAPYFTGVKRFLIQKDNAMEVGSLDDIDMRLPGTLSDFIKWGVATYPADKYILILSDHGGAWTGCCNDESLGPQVMDLAAIAAGINGGGVNFDMIGFDECLMANLEVAWALKDSGKILVASEEIEPGPGWDWTAWLSALAANPAMDAEAIGKTIADGFKVNIEQKAANQANIITLSVTDLTQIPALAAATTKLAEALMPAASNLQTWRPLAQARNASYLFGAQGQGDEGLTIDLGVFASSVASTAGAASAELMTALNAAVKYKVAGAKFPNAGGLSIYLPLRKVLGNYAQVDFPKATKWGQLVVAYVVQAASDTTPPQVSLTVMPMGGGRSLVQAQSADGDVAQSNTVLAAADGTFLGELPAQLGNDQMFDGEWPALSDGTNDAFAPMFATDEDAGGTVVVIIPADVDVDGSGNFIPAQLRMEINPATKMGTLVGAFDFSDDVVAEIDLEAPGALVRPRKITAQDGSFSDAPGEVTLSAAGLMVKPLPAPAEAQLGVHVSDLAGNDTVALVSATAGGTVSMGGTSGGGGGNSGGAGGCSVGGSPAPSGLWLLLLFAFLYRRPAHG